MRKLTEKDCFKELIIKAQNDDSRSMQQIIERLSPLIIKYSLKLGYADAYSDLCLWVLEAIKHHKPNVIWETN